MKLILLIIFYLIIAPLGMLLRLFGKDLLNWDRNKKTYWNEK